MTLPSFLRSIALLGALVFSSGCFKAYEKSVGAEIERKVTRSYLTTFDPAWQAIQEALKSYRLDVSNRESGIVQTRWQDNTGDKNLKDSFGGQNIFLKAKFRFTIIAAEGFYKGRRAVKVSVQKEQVVQYDVLEGFRKSDSDLTEENTLLYRIGRIIQIREQLAAIDEKLRAKALESQ